MRLSFALLPTIFPTPALFLLARYPLSHARMEEIRQQLEARRGEIPAATSAVDDPDPETPTAQT